MSGVLDGRIVVVTGAGGGLGRSHAKACAAAGAKVVVNDLGSRRDGIGADSGAAEAVATEIRNSGGQAIANADDVADWSGAKRLIDQCIEVFGGLDVLVNNAGIVRDRMLVNMSEEEWDAVIRVHLRGTFLPSRHAAEYWRTQSRLGHPRDARIVNTSSSSGLFGNIGQSNYGAAKAGIAGFTLVAAGELQRYGVTVNAISPTARTRMTEDLAAEVHGLDADDVSPVVVWLASKRSSDVTGRVISVRSGRISVLEGWANGPTSEVDSTSDPVELDNLLSRLCAIARPNASMNGTATTS
ncbi:MAG: SDR family NAD(P)-dependent oxidoreductase [Hyphomicrobiales bacterium]|nr:MAG: SDR family NAD(P)-dependent oxidoreductase [Hyphomicrobiales bacterium]